MKNARGISVIALVITVVVIVIITSITAYTGINMISDTRKKEATDKLKVICNALRRDDSFLNFESGDAILTHQDYISLDLAEYYDEDYPVHLEKSTTSTPTELTKEYTLKMYKGDETVEPYTTESFLIIKALEKNVYEAAFDELKGVNRPIIKTNMYALTNDGTALVTDVYEEDWYNYNSTVPSFAKMKYDQNGDGDVEDDVMYVWVPRFAYSIQTYYNGVNYPDKSYKNVNPAAIQIAFLRGHTNYMSNDEVIPSGFQIHPAFSMGDIELSGIWVEMETSESATSLSSAISDAASIVNGRSDMTSHLMTNSEFSAALYLMFALDCFEEINFTLQNEFVAAGLSNSSIINGLEYADKYVLDSDMPTGISEKIGDAMLETNWNRLIADYPTAAKPCVVRLLKSGYFDFTAVTESASSYYYRSVIISN